MARRTQPLTVTASIRLEDGSIVSWDSLSDEKQAYCRRKMAENSGRHMSLYYAAHPEEYEKLESL